MKKLKNFKSFVWVLFIAAFIGLASSVPNSFIQAIDVTITRYLIWGNSTNRNAATADSIMGFVNGSDTATMIPMPSGLTNYWEQSNDSLYPTTATDNLFALDSVYFSGLPYKVSDTMIVWDRDTVFRMAISEINPMTTIGDLVHRNGSNVTARLPIGANTYVLTSNGTVPAWAVASGGGDTSFFDLVGETLSLKTAIDSLYLFNDTLVFDGSKTITDTNSNTCVWLGLDAGRTNAVHGVGSVGIGYLALEDNATGDNFNTAIGYQAGMNNLGQDNTFVGSYTGDAYTGNAATLIGHDAGGSLTTGTGTVAVGFEALRGSVNYSNNTAVGYQVLENMTAGAGVTAIGYRAGQSGTGSYNVYVGQYAGTDESGDYKIMIDNRDRTSEALGRTLAPFYSETNATGTSQLTAIGGGGNVGIGTIAPEASLHIVDETTGDNILWLKKYNTNVAGSPNIDFYKYNGTPSSYAAIATSTMLGDIQWNASYDASNTAPCAQILVQSTQPYTSVNRGNWMAFYTTENDSTTWAASVVIDEHANLEVPYGDVIVRQGWRTWTPTLTWTGGAITGATVVARYQTINETVTFQLDISGTNSSGTAATALTVTLPETPDDINVGCPVTCLYSSSAKVAHPTNYLAAYIDMEDGTPANRILYTGTFSVANSADYRFVFSGTYEITGD